MIYEHTLVVITVVVILCIVIVFAFWLMYVRKTKRPLSALINNIDNKSLNSTNSKDSGTGESTKRSQEQIYNECTYQFSEEKMFAYFKYLCFI